MPRFDFRCKKCGFVEEFVLRLSDPLPSRCSRCGGPLVKLIPRSVGIAFKGSGFYVTDSRKTTSVTQPTSQPPARNPETPKTPAPSPEKPDAKPDSGQKKSGP